MKSVHVIASKSVEYMQHGSLQVLDPCGLTVLNIKVLQVIWTFGLQNHFEGKFSMYQFVVVSPSISFIFPSLLSPLCIEQFQWAIPGILIPFQPQVYYQHFIPVIFSQCLSMNLALVLLQYIVYLPPLCYRCQLSETAAYKAHKVSVSMRLCISAPQRYLSCD